MKSIDSSKKTDIDPIASAYKEIREALRKAKMYSERAEMKSSTKPPSIYPTRRITSQLLQMLDYGASCQKDSNWPSVVEGISAYANKEAWGYVGGLPGCV